MSVRELVAALDELRARLLSHRDQVRASAENLTGSGRRLAGIVGRSTHPRVQDAQRRIAEAVARLVDSQKELSRAVDILAEYRASIATGSDPPPDPVSLGPASTDDVAVHRSAEPRWIIDALADVPSRIGGKGPTTGLAFDRNGDRLFGGPIASGRDIASTAGLRPVTPSGKGWPWTLTDHVEAAVAARMREPGGPRDVTLLLNNAPCADDPYGCDRLLRHMIPAGSRVTVYVKSDDPDQPVRRYGTYEGTGRLIQS